MRPTTHNAAGNSLLSCLQHDPPDWDFLDALLSELIILPTLSEQALLFCSDLCAHLKAAKDRLLASVTPQHAHRLLNVFTSVANIQQKVDGNTSSTLCHYINAIEAGIRLSPPLSSGNTLTFRDIILASWFASFTFSTLPPSTEPSNILRAIQSHACAHHLPRFEGTSLALVHAVHDASDGFINAMLDSTTGTLPNVVLFPDQAQMLSTVVFGSPHTTSDICSPVLHSSQSTYEVKIVTSSALLTLARRIQEGASITELGLDIPHCSNNALVLLLHYLALSLFPSPAAFNDTGVILCNLSNHAATNFPRVASGRDVARLYYEKGLQIDPTHPHLLSNFGSLLKDAGLTNYAIGVFNYALQFHPELDIALANMANTLKDTGRSADAIPYYLKAVTVNPGLVDAYCGLSMAMNSICNWTARDHWMISVITTCEEHLSEPHHQNIGILGEKSLDDWLLIVALATARPQCDHSLRNWVHRFCLFADVSHGRQPLNEGSFLLRLIDWYRTRKQHQRYIETYGEIHYCEEVPNCAPEAASVAMPFASVLSSVSFQKVPTVLPFHTFTLPLSSSAIRRIAHRNALRASHNVMTQLSLDQGPIPPPPPVKRRINIGYVSSDFSDHPLSHLMKSVFGLHNRNQFCIFLYATSPSDGSAFRLYYEQGDFNFLDVSSWSNVDIVNRIKGDRIHILVDLGGYTKGAKNEIFAARPSPIQISLMGYAGTLAASWCDYLVCDSIACPVDLFARVQAYWKRSLDQCCQNSDVGVPVGEEGDPESPSPNWIYTECPIYMPHTYFVTDHKQSYRLGDLPVEERAQATAKELWDGEIKRRKDLRRALFPDLPLDFIIFSNFNQIDPDIFATWLRILARVPRSILWLLRFPAAGEAHLIQVAKAWAGGEIASRIRFTDVTSKDHHIYRCRVPDLFLDTSECSAHTVAADVLWSGTPLIACAWSSHRHKMSSRVAASLASATGFGEFMVVSSKEEYEERAVALGNSMHHTVQPNGDVEASGDLLDLRRCLFLNRDSMPLFDTERWTRNLEKAYRIAWRRWVDGSMFKMCDDGCIWVKDDVDVPVRMD
ncbi:hypothetical protein AZE42_02366 [Rhizopogon vesiculosus]|uniref:protein O-GlcNAc transferase n=1 Tax=Rhizopogon vesiculosus TaxID=180088 RepID=A0A1J8QHD5_9AGAM|nr:hypothetical protein AZE42_02366 [Rhizopogon vesiculosus]